MKKFLFLFLPFATLPFTQMSCSKKIACPTYATSFPDKPSKKAKAPAKNTPQNDEKKKKDEEGAAYHIPKKNKTKSGVFEKGFFK